MEQASYNHHQAAMQQMVASATVQHPRGEPCFQTPQYRDAFFLQQLHPTFSGGIESYLDPKYASDPAAFASRLPYFPFRAYGVYDYGFEPAFIRKRNERERQRVKCVNDGYARLREHLPEEFTEKRLSKVETLRGAIQYIKNLQKLLGVEKEAKKRKTKSTKSAPLSSPPNNEEEEKISSHYSSDDSIQDDVRSDLVTSPRTKSGEEKSRGIPEKRTACLSEQSSSCMFANKEFARTYQSGAEERSGDGRSDEWRYFYPETCIYSNRRLQASNNSHIKQNTADSSSFYYKRVPHNSDHVVGRVSDGLGIADAECQGYRFHPYDRQRRLYDSSGVERDFYGYRGHFKQERSFQEGPEVYHKRLGCVQQRFDQLDASDGFARSDECAVMTRGYARDGGSDGFKSDTSPGSSSTVSTSP